MYLAVVELVGWVVLAVGALAYGCFALARRRRAARQRVARQAMSAKRQQVPSLVPAGSLATGRAAGQPQKEAAMERAQEILDRVCGYLDTDEVGYSVREDEYVIHSAFEGDTAYYNLAIYVHENVLGFSVRLPLRAPEEKLPALAETVARANFGLLLGAFRLHYREGRIVFRVGMPIADGELTYEQFRTLAGSSLHTADRYHRAFLRLLYGDDLSPAEVIAEVEMDEE